MGILETKGQTDIPSNKDAWKPIEPNQNILTGKNPSIQDKLLIRISTKKRVHLEDEAS